MSKRTATKTTKAPSKIDWRAELKAALEAAAKKSGFDITALAFEGCSTDSTWGDRCGLVFFGASDEVNERAAKFFEAWALRHLQAMGVVGGYDSQESISYFGEMHYARYSNGAKGWHRGKGDKVTGTSRRIGDGEHAFDLVLEETREGYATSYVYYPCAD